LRKFRFAVLFFAQSAFALADMPASSTGRSDHHSRLDLLREIRASFRATSFTEIAKIVERVECPTFQRLSQSIRSHFRRKVSFGDDIADLFSAFDNGR
jgi:hypothetical protein